MKLPMAQFVTYGKSHAPVFSNGTPIEDLAGPANTQQAPVHVLKLTRHNGDPKFFRHALWLDGEV